MSGLAGYHRLPDNLPRPENDGAADHLPGMRVPEVELPATVGGPVWLARISGRVVVYIYPMTGRPGIPLPEGWDDIPGARGCTPETLGFKDAHARIEEMGAAVFGLSTQDTDYQREMARRLGIPFPVLSDAEFRFSNALDLPTMEVEGRVLLKRLTLIIRDGCIEQVFYPVFPPDKAARQALDWLAEHVQ